MNGLLLKLSLMQSENHMSFIYEINEWIIIVFLFALLALAYQFGYTWGKKANKIKPSSHSTVTLAQLTGLIGFLGILLGFTFSMSNSRFEKRKELVIQESLDIGTAYFRLGLIEDSLKRREMRLLMKEYLDGRIKLYDSNNSIDELKQELAASEKLQVKLWSKSAELGRANHDINTSLIIQSLNEMIDITGSIQGAVQNHVPGIIILILFIVSILTITTLGYSHGFLEDKNWTFAICASSIIIAFILLIIDMDRPNSGLLKVDVQSLINLRKEIMTYDK